jgi:suppressor of ftsI
MRRFMGSVLLAGCMLVAGRGAASPPPFANPPEMTSAGGQLTGTLTVAPGEVEIAGRRFTTTLYDGAYMPPVLRVQPGDTIRIVLANAGGMVTNVHYHGLAVTPLQPGDDVFIQVDPGSTYQYDFPIPPDHPSGLFWYHPHRTP